MKFVHYLVISDVSTGLLACEIVIGLEYVVEVSPEIPYLKVFDAGQLLQCLPSITDAVDPTVADLTTLPVNHFFRKDEVGRIEIVSDDLPPFVTDRNRTIDFLLPWQVFKQFDSIIEQRNLSPFIPFRFPSQPVEGRAQKKTCVSIN